MGGQTRRLLNQTDLVRLSQITNFKLKGRRDVHTVFDNEPKRENRFVLLETPCVPLCEVKIMYGLKLGEHYHPGLVQKIMGYCAARTSPPRRYLDMLFESTSLRYKADYDELDCDIEEMQTFFFERPQ